MMENKTVKFIVNAAVIAALYAALTLLLMPVSFGIFQVRISEVLCMLSLFTPAAIPGLTIGCFISNMVGPNGIVDAVLGSLATLVGAFGMWKLRKKLYIAPLVNVLANGIVIGLMLCYVYHALSSPIAAVAIIALEEAAAMYILGIPLAKVIKANAKDIF